MTSVTVDFLVEEPSMESALHKLVPPLLGPEDSYVVRVFQGKQDLLKRLAQRLLGYRNELTSNPGRRVMVLVDEDRADCHGLKTRLEQAAGLAGLTTKTHPGSDGSFTVVSRVVVEELEAWFFGDVQAIRAAYPKVPASLGSRAAYRIPDGIRGGTAEQLERVLKAAGYHPGGLAKMSAAEAISAYMVVSRNTSVSFGHFVSGLDALVHGGAHAAA